MKELKQARYDWLREQLHRLTNSSFINDKIADYIGEIEDEIKELEKELGIKS